MQINSPKVLVYTANFGQKDEFPRLANKGKAPENVHFICVTDNPETVSEEYEIQLTHSKYRDSVKSARYYKIHGIPSITDYDIAIWHDSSIVIDCSKLENLIGYGENTLSVFLHDETCTYAEARNALATQKDNPLRIAFQMAYYGVVLKYPTRNGVFETGLMVKNVKKFQGSEFMTMWWNHVKQMSCRDQLSFPIARWITGTKVGILKGRGHDNPYSSFRGHIRPDYQPVNLFLKFNNPMLRKMSLWFIYRVELYVNSRKKRAV